MVDLLLCFALAAAPAASLVPEPPRTGAPELLPALQGGRKGKGAAKGSGKGKGRGKGAKGGGRGGGAGRGAAKGGGGSSKPKLVFSERFRRTRAEHVAEQDEPGALFAPTAERPQPAPGAGRKGAGAGRGAGRETPPYLIADDEEILALQRVADWNENGWIAFAEARDSMQFDRLRFAAYDTDSDGRLVDSEFRGYYFDSMRRNARFEAPKPRPDRSRPPPRSAEQLRNAYDRDLDQSLSRYELERLVEDYGRADLDPGQLLLADDANGDGRLDLREIEGVVALLYPVGTQVTDETLLGGEAASLLELFRRVVPRETTFGIPPPPLILGPVPPFHRLDLNHDGAIGEDDLRALLRPLHESIRLGAVLGILDRDGDRVLNVSEFERALGGGEE